MAGSINTATQKESLYLLDVSTGSPSSVLKESGTIFLMPTSFNGDATLNLVMLQGAVPVSWSWCG